MLGLKANLAAKLPRRSQRRDHEAPRRESRREPCCLLRGDTPLSGYARNFYRQPECRLYFQHRSSLLMRAVYFDLQYQKKSVFAALVLLLTPFKALY